MQNASVKKLTKRSCRATKSRQLKAAFSFVIENVEQFVESFCAPPTNSLWKSISRRSSHGSVNNCRRRRHPVANGSAGYACQQSREHFEQRLQSGPGVLHHLYGTRAGERIGPDRRRNAADPTALD